MRTRGIFLRLSGSYLLSVKGDNYGQRVISTDILTDYWKSSSHNCYRAHPTFIDCIQDVLSDLKTQRKRVSPLSLSIFLPLSLPLLLPLPRSFSLRLSPSVFLSLTLSLFHFLSLSLSLSRCLSLSSLSLALSLPTRLKLCHRAVDQ